MGVDVLGLPHTIMLTAANVNDRKGAVDMIDYYCRNTDYLSDIKKFQMMKWKLSSVMKCIHLLFFQNVGLSNVLLAGSINVVAFGKIANENYRTLFK